MQIYTNIFFFFFFKLGGTILPCSMYASVLGGMGARDGSGTSQSGAEWSHFNNHNESDEIKIKYEETRQW